jgi:hypothetical protein
VTTVDNLVPASNLNDPSDKFHYGGNFIVGNGHILVPTSKNLISCR